MIKNMTSESHQNVIPKQSPSVGNVYNVMPGQIKSGGASTPPPLKITQIFAYLRGFMNLEQNFKNKTLQPIGSSFSSDILIITKFDM